MSRATLRTVVAHELRLMLRDRTLPLCALLLTGLGLWGLYNGMAAADARAALAAEARRDEGRQFADFRQRARPSGELETGSTGFDPATNPGVLALFYPRVAVLPPAPLAALSVGQADVYPTYFRVSAERRDSFLDAAELTNPLHLLTGSFDLAFVVVYVLPLFLLLLCHDLCAGERARGVLAQVLAQPVRLSTLVAGKLVARAYPIAVVVGLTALALLLTGRLAAAGAWPGLAVWTALVAAYGAVWLAVGAAVDRLGRGPGANAVLLAGLWLVLVVLAPAATHIAVSRLAPVPPRSDLVIATRDADTRSRRPVELLQAYYREHPDRYPSHPEFDLETYDFPLYWFAIQREVERLMQPVLARYDAALADRQRLVAKVRFLLPPVLAQQASNDLAGTGLARNRRFLDQVAAFHREHVAFYEPLIVSKAGLDAGHYDAMPHFVFEEEPPTEAAGRAGVAAGGLFILALVVFAVPAIATAVARRLRRARPLLAGGNRV